MASQAALASASLAAFLRPFVFLLQGSFASENICRRSVLRRNFDVSVPPDSMKEVRLCSSPPPCMRLHNPDPSGTASCHQRRPAAYISLYRIASNLVRTSVCFFASDLSCTAYIFVHTVPLLRKRQRHTANRLKNSRVSRPKRSNQCIPQKPLLLFADDGVCAARNSSRVGELPYRKLTTLYSC